jgi:hypothetical protein
MTPSDPLVKAVNAGLADPNFRASVRQMNEENYPFLKMIDALGLEDDLSYRISQIVATLSPETVLAIRQATLEMLDRDEQVMPLDCGVNKIDLSEGTPIEVNVAQLDGKPTIRVRSSTSV